MKYIIDKKIRVGYLTAFLLLLLSYVLLFVTTNQMLNQTELVNHTDKVINKLEVLQSEIKSVESSYRGFLITKDESYLEYYYLARMNIDTFLRDSRVLVSDSKIQKARLDTLTELFKKRLDIISGGISIFKANDKEITDTTKAIIYHSRDVALQIRTMVRRMQFYERALMQERLEDLTAYHNSINAINIASLIIAVLLSIYSLVTYTTENRSRREADQKTLQYRHLLEQRISELNQANKELTELRLNEKFAATGRISRTIAHEVRNPLTNIGLATEQLKDMVIQNEESTLLLNMIKRNGNRINQLVSDLLNATKYSELQFSNTSINTVIEETLEMAKDRIGLFNIKVEKTFTQNLPNINVDTEKIKIALLNIIVNAIEAMTPEKGILQIRTDRGSTKSVVITIRDNGSGMDKESLSKLFEPFFTSKEKGTGLGLTNTQNIILNHKGKISVDSEQGKGTSFTIVLDFDSNATV